MTDTAAIREPQEANPAARAGSDVRAHRPPPPDHEISLARKIINLIGVVLPFAGLIAAIVLLWHQAVGPLELALMLGLYVLTCLGVTLGYHRMFTHRALDASRPFRAAIAVLGSMAVQGSVIKWVATRPTWRVRASGAPPRDSGMRISGGSSRRSGPPTASASRPTS
jgi:hypothetical protein